MHTSIHTHTYPYTNARTHAYAHTHTHTHAHTRTHTCTNTYSPIYTHVHMHSCALPRMALTLDSAPSSSHSVTSTAMLGGMPGRLHTTPDTGSTLGCCRHLLRHTRRKICGTRAHAHALCSCALFSGLGLSCIERAHMHMQTCARACACVRVCACASNVAKLAKLPIHGDFAHLAEVVLDIAAITWWLCIPSRSGARHSCHYMVVSHTWQKWC